MLKGTLLMERHPRIRVGQRYGGAVNEVKYLGITWSVRKRQITGKAPEVKMACQGGLSV